ncbi:MAG: MarR family transcriptional regulator [Devosia sp.]|jgi:DNA-binding MarR family transcriptional regulator
MRLRNVELDTQPALDDLIRELSAELSQAYRWAAEQAGLNQTDLLGLYFINAANGTATPKSLAEHLGLTSGATAILLNRLQARDYVVRTPHPTDRRGVLLSLGQAARDQEFLKLRERMLGLNADVIAALSPEEAAIVRRFIGDMLTNTRDSLRQLRLGTTQRDDA